MRDRLRFQLESSCRKLLKPIIKTLLRCGLSAGEFTNICKSVFVQTAAEQLFEGKKRINQSRVAIVTGLTRAEVKRLLHASSGDSAMYEWHRHRATRVLAGWHQDLEFLDRNRRPRDLVFSGKKGSFQSLVRRYSGDIPVRAMLDELLSAGSVEARRNGTLRIKSRTVAAAGIDVKSIAALGEKARDYLNTLTHNMEHPDSQRFEQSAWTLNIRSSMAPVIKRAIEIQAQSFINSVDDRLESATLKRNQTSALKTKARLGVTVFVFEDNIS